MRPPACILSVFLTDGFAVPQVKTFSLCMYVDYLAGLSQSVEPRFK